MTRDCKKLMGRSRAICEGRSGLPWHVMNKYLVRWGMEPYSSAEWAEVANSDAAVAARSVQRPMPPKQQRKELVGDALAEKIQNLVTIRTGTGCGCLNLQNDMNKWGAEGCEKNRESIINQLVAKREMLTEAFRSEPSAFGLGKIAAAALNFAPEAMLRIGAGILLDLAIAEAKKRFENPPPEVSPRELRKSLVQGLPRKSNQVLKLSNQQKKLWEACKSRPAPIADPFTESPVIHFGAHLWPVVGNWEWHVDNWNEVAESITGKCVVVVVTDSSSVTVDAVRERLSDRFEIVEGKNTPQGENPSFRLIQTLIPGGQNDILIYCHGKAVRPHTYASPSVLIWTQMMYETVVFNHSAIIDRMSQGYQCFGSFRTFGDMPLSPKNQWHYSGTFFAVRSKYLSGKNVKSGYGGVEAWPGDHILPEHSWCEFTDSPGFKFGYDINAVYPSIVNAQMQWEVDRIGGPRCEQHLRELDWFANYLKPHDRVLVIGSKHGGLEHQLKRRLPELAIVSVDINPQPDNAAHPMIVGSSLDYKTQQLIIAHGPFDVVFIDGDHSYEGVLSDWEFAKSLNPRLIAFHDVAKAVKHDREGCEVDRLWAEIKTTHNTSEKIVGCGWGGIGIVMTR